MRVGDKVKVLMDSADTRHTYRVGEIRTVTYISGKHAYLDCAGWGIAIRKLEVVYDFNDYLKILV